MLHFSNQPTSRPGITMVWDKTYGAEKKVWGDTPSELAQYAGNFLKQSSQFRDNPDIFILDLGCGYGRDSIFLAKELPCHILGVDNSRQAIAMAKEALPRELEKKIEFLCYDVSLVADKYDVILCSNVYSILKPAERAGLRKIVSHCLRSNGLLFLSAFSVHDIQHKKTGIPVEDENYSFIDEKYIHLCSREELEQDFSFLDISALFERQFLERRSTRDHNHVIWLLMGRLL
jgi:cyclopropane fatty-acyl-phospholipid synthase-like methyltransferase